MLAQKVAGGQCAAMDVGVYRVQRKPMSVIHQTGVARVATKGFLMLQPIHSFSFLLHDLQALLTTRDTSFGPFISRGIRRSIYLKKTGPGLREIVGPTWYEASYLHLQRRRPATSSYEP